MKERSEMFKPTIADRILHLYIKKTRNLKASHRRKALNNKDFTIISNNCWGGITYEEYGLPKASPTIGGYFFTDDYLKFVGNLKYYLSLDIKFVAPEQSKHYDWLVENGDKDAIVAVLDDVEVIFIHYHSEAAVKEKWERRVARVNWDNLIFKFSKSNHASDKDCKTFDELALPGKKFMFINDKNHTYKCGAYYPGFDDDTEVHNDTYFGNRFFDVTKFINTGEIVTKSR